MHVFACLAPDLYAQMVLIDKNFASELSRKFIKSALLVGQKLGNMRCCAAEDLMPFICGVNLRDEREWRTTTKKKTQQDF